MSIEQGAGGSPRVFISYAWTSAEHQEWVLALATQLRADGIDVVLDVWDLKAGQDKYSFMEQMVVDDTIQKVLIVCNQMYADKANNRAGGVGDETQIITPEVFGNVRSEKFVPVIAERDADGQACVPTYIKSRIYVDVSSAQTYYEGYEQLLRLIHGAPALAKPPVGKKPAHLDEQATTGSGTAPLLRRSIHALESSQRGGDSLARSYLASLGKEIAALRVRHEDGVVLDDQVVEAIKQGKVYRDEFLLLLDALCNFSSTPTIEKLLTGFFEQLLRGCHQAGGGAWREPDFDPVRFLLLELFLYATAALLESDHLEALSGMLAETYAFNRNGGLHTGSYAEFYDEIASLERLRKQRLNLNRTSLVADALKERADCHGISFEQLQQADFILCVKAHVANRGWWHPRTLVYLGHHPRPFEIFAASESKRRFAKIKAVFGVSNLEEFRTIIEKAFVNPRDAILSFGNGWSQISIRALLNLPS